MTSKSAPGAAGAQTSSAVSPSRISQRTSSTLSYSSVSSSTIISSAAIRPSTSYLLSSTASPSQIPPTHAAAGKSNRVVIIAATTASIASLLILLSLGFFLYRRRRSRQKRMASQPLPFLCRSAGSYDETGWKYSARSTTGSGWPGQDSEPTSPVQRTFPIPFPVECSQMRQSVGSSFGCSVGAKPPHYIVRSRASIIDYGFGQDLAWQDAHYEDPLPMRIGSAQAQYPAPAIDVTPPTPSSGIIHHDLPTATSLLRGNSTASTISSLYSKESMLPDVTSPPPPDQSMTGPAFIHDVLATDDRNWIHSPQIPDEYTQSKPRHLV